MTSCMDIRTKIDDVALIFEGGGMRASYTAGFVAMLLEQRVDFMYVAGISAGSSHAVNYLSRDLPRSRQSYTDLPANPAFGDLGTWIRGEGFFNSDFIYDESSQADGQLPFDYRAFVDNEADCVIAAFKESDGSLIHWHKKDYKVPQDLILSVRASSSVPFMMPETVIDGEVYWDGGLGTPMPLDEAKRDGYEKFVFVLTRERGYRMPEPSPLWITHRILDRHPIIKDALLTRHLRYNAQRDEIERLEVSGHAYVFYPDRLDLTMVDRNPDKLLRQFALGHEQSYRELPQLAAFLGI